MPSFNKFNYSGFGTGTGGGASYDGSGSGGPHNSYSPSAPPFPPSPSSSSSASAPGYGYSQQPQQQQVYGYGGSYGTYGGGGYGSYGGGGGGGEFPAGTGVEVVRAFEAVDRDRSGTIDEVELQLALSSGYQKFARRTVRLLMFLFRNPSNPSSSRIGPSEFAALWKCLGNGGFDRDRSGKIDSNELKDALLSIGYAVPPSVIQVLVSKYDDGRGGRGALSFDNFVECGTIFKGLTEKFKEKDPRYTGSATLKYDEFMTMVIPFLVDD